MKHLFMLMLFLIGILSQTFAQNPYWSFPPNYVNFASGGTISTLVSGTTATKDQISNAIFSPNGTLQLFLGKKSFSNKYINRFDVETGLFTGISNNNTDIALTPYPGLCNSFLIPFSTVVVGPSSPYYIFFNKVDFNGTSGMCSSTLTFSNQFTHHGTFGMAATPSPNPLTSTRKAFLYLVRPHSFPGTSSSTVYVDALSATTPSNLVFETFEATTIGGSGTMHILEADLSADGTKLAFCIKDKNVLYVVNVSGCENGGCGTSNLSTYTVSGATSINGVEFGPDGKLFYTKSGAFPNHISYYNFATGTHTDVANSNGLGNSFLELALDGYMYVSDGSNLKGFAVSSSSYSISKTISGVSNTTVQGVYSLPDQIDWSNYGNIDGSCQTGPVTYSTSPLPSTAKVNGALTVQNTAAVDSGSVAFTASSNILLQPNFSVAYGSQFSGKIVPCATVCTANGCSSTTYRTEDVQASLESEETKLLAYPNPLSSGKLNFSCHAQSFSLIDSKGKIVIQGSNNNNIDISKLQKGVYLLKLDDKAQKIVIQ